MIYISNSYEIEQLWIKININNNNFILGLLYKPPNLDYNIFLSHFENTISLLLPDCDELLRTGDFNINLLNYHSPATLALYTVLDSYNLAQVVDESTRVTE